MFGVTGCLVLCLLAVEGAITAQLTADEDRKDNCCQDKSAPNLHGSLQGSDSPRLTVTRDENRIDGHQLQTVVINTSNGDTSTACPTWFYPRTLSNGSTECECGSDLGEIVRCNSTSHVVSLLQCYSMTYNNDKSSLVVGASYYMAVIIQHMTFV